MVKLTLIARQLDALPLAEGALQVMFSSSTSA
jgi:hypothetical protein